jgi:hypothetical protein
MRDPSWARFRRCTAGSTRMRSIELTKSTRSERSNLSADAKYHIERKNSLAAREAILAPVLNVITSKLYLPNIASILLHIHPRRLYLLCPVATRAVSPAVTWSYTLVPANSDAAKKWCELLVERDIPAFFRLQWTMPNRAFSAYQPLASFSVIPQAGSNHQLVFPNMPRGPGWTPADDADLAKSWSRISGDPVIGIDQTASSFWARIAVEYNTLSRRRDAQERVERSACSIKSRWNSVVRPNCSKFVSALQTIEDIRPTGATEQDKINLAIALYNGRDPKDRNAVPGEFPQLEA